MELRLAPYAQKNGAMAGGSGLDEDPSLLDVAEVAVRLGTWKESGERFPRRLIEERRIAFVKVGRNVRISERVLDEYIAANTVQPVTVRPGVLRRVA